MSGGSTSNGAPSRALILDCDGVLADTERDGHLVAFNQTFEELGFPFRWSEDEYGVLLKIGGGKERMRGYLAAHPEIDLGSADELDEKIVAAHKRKSEIYIQLVDEGRLPGRPGVKRLVEEALDAGWQVAVASTSAARSVEAVLRAVVGEQTRARMAGVWAGDIVPAKKPAPDIYLLTLKELGREPAEAVVVEDSESGAQAAANAGLRHVVTVSSFTGADPFPAATVVVSDLGEPGAPAQVRAGLDVRNDEGVVDVAALSRVLDEADAPA
jgi:HAD superfamily hydrolase (TIGR01509 family)